MNAKQRKKKVIIKLDKRNEISRNKQQQQFNMKMENGKYLTNENKIYVDVYVCCTFNGSRF